MQPPTENVSGLIERVTFHSEESGFSVLRVQVKGQREPVTVVGTLAGVNPGEWIDAEGQWLVDPRHGRQFKAAEIRSTRPDTLDGIEKYLGSGLIKGIGPVYADKLVKKFGRDVFEVIEARSAELEKVEGIGPGRRRAIKEAWNQQKTVREIMTFLFSHGVTTSRAYRIWKQYGDQAIETVRKDPYCLARDIRGIGFKSADTIASHLGVRHDSDLRARAGVEYILLELTSEGHCAFPRAALIEKAAAQLGIDESIVERAIEHGLATQRLTVGRGDSSEPFIYLALVDRAERRTAKALIRLMQGVHPCPEIDLNAAIPWVEEKLRLKLAEAQKEAIARALCSKVMVITGGPGVGKTTLVNALLRLFRAKELKVVLAAPTGRAAKRMAEVTGAYAKTLHRLLVFDPTTGEFKHTEKNPLKGDVFVIDESSMIDIHLASQLVAAIPPDAALLWIGDVDQLPSVGPGSVLRDIIDSGVVPVARLRHVFRQAAASAIIANAHRVNEGAMPVYPEEKVSHPDASDFYFVRADEPGSAAALVVKLVSRSLPDKFRLDPLRDIQVLTPMRRGELGATNLNRLLQAALNPSGPQVERFGTLFREGDKVMQTQNDYDKDVFNGDIGIIRKIDEEARELVVRFEESDVVYDFQELDELSPSYAVTIHKSQGSEYPCVVVPIHTQHYVMLQRNLLYTAITRGKRLVVLVGTQKALAMAVKNIDSRQRFTTLKQRLVEGAGSR